MCIRRQTKIIKTFQGRRVKKTSPKNGVDKLSILLYRLSRVDLIFGHNYFGGFKLIARVERVHRVQYK